MQPGSYLKSGFSIKQLNLKEIKDAEVKKIIFIGDGMSGKTQIVLTAAKQIIYYLHKIYYSTIPRRDDQILQQADAILNEKSFEISPSFQQWAESQRFLVQYGRIKWDVSEISLDTETIGFEDFHFHFPFAWKGRTYRIKLSGSDVGGQNIFDHMRNVLGKFAGATDVIIVVFDKSRALSCWNSIEQIKNVLGEKIEDQYAYRSNIPQIVYVGNKIDLEEHVRSQKWRADLLRSLMKKVRNALNFGKGVYKLPSLVGSKGTERTIQYKLDNQQISFPDLEAFIYNSIRESDPKYSIAVITDVNAKALAREIAAQLVFNRILEERQSWTGEVKEEEMISIMNDFGNILFQRRPLAMQYSGGIEYMEKTTETDSFARVRTKWMKYWLNFQSLRDSQVETALMSAANARSFLEEMGDFHTTNALQGNGVLELMDSVIQKKLELAEKEPRLSKPSRTIKRRIKRF
jgi:GTPase SAR1 family protein